MDNHFRVLFFCLLFLALPTAHSQTLNYCPTATQQGFYMSSNGCSDSIRSQLEDTNWLIDVGASSVVGPVLYFGVDKLDPFVDFKNACVHHDFCYATPGKSKTICDKQFETNMKKNCDSKYKPEWVSSRECNAIAGVFGLGSGLLCHTVRKQKLNPLNAHCKNVAAVYYNAVKYADIADSEYKDWQATGEAAKQICADAGELFMVDYVPPASTSPPKPKCAKIDIGMSCNQGQCGEAFGRTCYAHGGVTVFEGETMVCRACAN